MINKRLFLRLKERLSVITDDLMTVKELADKLDTTKNRVAYQVRKVADDNIKLIDGVQYLNKQAQDQVINAIKQLDIEQSADIKQEETQEKSDNNTVINLLKQRIESLEILTETLQAQLEQRDDQLSAKDTQINQLHTIIATQAQQAGVKRLESDNTDGKRSWWQRFFS